MAIGDRIMEARLDKDMTRYALSKKLDVREQSIWLWETGRRTPRIEKLKQLASVLKKTLDWLAQDIRV